MTSHTKPSSTSEEALCVDMVRTQMEFIKGNIDWLADRLCKTKQATVKFNARLQDMNKEMVEYLSATNTQICLLQSNNTSKAIVDMLKNMLRHHGKTIVALYDVLGQEMNQTEIKVCEKWVVEFYTSHKLAKALAKLDSSTDMNTPVYLMLEIKNEVKRLLSLKTERDIEQADKKQRQKDKKKEKKKRQKATKAVTSLPQGQIVEKNDGDESEDDQHHDLSKDDVEHVLQGEQSNNAPMPVSSPMVTPLESHISAASIPKNLSFGGLERLLQKVSNVLKPDENKPLEVLPTHEIVHKYLQERDKEVSEEPVATPSEPVVTTDPPENPRNPRRILPLPTRRVTKSIVPMDELLTADYNWMNMDDLLKEPKGASVKGGEPEKEAKQTMDEFEFDLRRMYYTMMMNPNYNSDWFTP